MFSSPVLGLIFTMSQMSPKFTLDYLCLSKTFITCFFALSKNGLSTKFPSNPGGGQIINFCKIFDLSLVNEWVGLLSFETSSTINDGFADLNLMSDGHGILTSGVGGAGSKCIGIFP